ncbi:MAG: lysophospholipid acyltransferase family protein [Planctomycetota bacterium]
MSLLRLATLFGIVFALWPLALATRLIAALGARGPAMRGGARVQALWARVSLPVLGVELDCPAPPPEGTMLVCANHLGYLDVFVLGALFPGRFVAMHEISGWPLLGWLARSTGTLFVDRERKRDVLAVGERMDETLAEGVSVVLFPEGRAGPGDALRPLKTPLFQGAARGGLPCLPVALAYETPGHPFSPAWTVSWWGGMDLWKHLRRLLRLPRIRAVVRFDAEPVRADDRKELAELVRGRLEALGRRVPMQPEPPDNPWRGLEP